MTEVAPRPRRWWLALLLNLLFAPTGYAYVGAWRWVAILAVALILGSLAAMEATRIFPPGVYGLGASGLIYAALGVMTMLGLHAALLARRAPGRTGPSRAILYVTPWIGLIVANLIVRAYMPHPTYTIPSESMSPTLETGDILMVEGARAECGARNLKPGDVVIHKREGTPYVARIVAASGQRVTMQDGRLVLDGVAVPQSAPKPAAEVRGATLREETLPNGVRYRIQDLVPDGMLDDTRTWTVPAGAWFLMGDNRDNAADSRVNGPIPGSDICARALKIVYAEDRRRVGQEF